MSLPHRSATPKAPDDDAVAWQLVAAAQPHLSRVDADRIFIHIGVGDTFDAIAALLTVIARDRIPVSPDLTATVASWLDCYLGQEAEPRLRDLLAVASCSAPPPGLGAGQRLDAVPDTTPRRRSLPS